MRIMMYGRNCKKKNVNKYIYFRHVANNKWSNNLIFAISLKNSVNRIIK